jgi:hypothetical protein
MQAIPGVIEHQGAHIQLLDLPGIVEGASQGMRPQSRRLPPTKITDAGRGRGRQVVASQSFLRPEMAIQFNCIF